MPVAKQRVGLLLIKSEVKVKTTYGGRILKTITNSNLNKNNMNDSWFDLTIPK